MKTYPIYIAVALVTGLSAYALYLNFKPDEKLHDQHNKDGYYDSPEIFTADYSYPENESVTVGGLTRRNKNKHMKKSRSKRNKRNKKQKK
jgi:hypothetical protein